MVETAIVIANIMSYVKFGIYTFIIGMFGLWIWFQMQYKIAAEIYRPKGDGKYEILRDKIRKKKVNGMDIFQLNKLKEEIPPIQDYGIFKFSNNLFGPKYMIKLYNAAPGVYYPIDGINTEGGLKENVIDGDLQIHIANRIERAKEVYGKKKTWEVLLPYLGIAGVLVFAIIVIYFLTERMDTFAGAWNGNMQGFLELMKSCQGVQNIPQK